jgi:hypothetical protein
VFALQGTAGPGRYDDFAKCLTREGATIYGTDTCTFCKDQKSDFGSSFQYVDYVNCDYEKSQCDLAGVSAYPTWTYDGNRLRGKQKLSYLSDLTGCRLDST